MTELGRSSISDAFSNFCWSSVFPMTFAAWLIWRMSSWSRRNTRMRLPSNWSVSWNKVFLESENAEHEIRELTLQISEKDAPRHHCTTASISSTLNDCTYSSSTIESFDSLDTCAILRANSCMTLNGAASSSFNFVVCSLYFTKTWVLSISYSLAKSGHTFSEKTKQLKRPAHCSGESGLKTPLKISSVRSNSSPVLISHATRPFMSTISAEVVKPRRRRTRFRLLSSSICKISCVAWILLLRSFIFVSDSFFFEYWV